MRGGDSPGKVTRLGRSFALHRNKGCVQEQLGEHLEGQDLSGMLGGAERPGGWKAEKTAGPTGRETFWGDVGNAIRKQSHGKREAPSLFHQ